jgi:hypothetical protein
MPFVTSQSQPYTIISSPSFFSAPVGSGVSGWLPANNGRTQSYAQVVGSGSPLYVSLNGQPASTGNFHVLLKPSAADMGADGGVWSNTSFRGPIFASGASLCKFVLWESRD